MENEKIGLGKIIQYGLRYAGVPVLLVIIIEALNRKSLVSGLTYMFERPSLFVFNTLIIMLTISAALFFKREIFVFCTISAIWLIFGIVNFVILQFRVTPFSAVDFTLIQSAISVSGHYLNALNIAMILVAVILLFVLIICLYRKAPKHSHLTQKKLISSGILVLLIVFALSFIQKNSNSVQALETNYTNISEAYENYGFVYCFTNSIIDTGIGQPEDYSEESVKEVLDTLPDQKSDVKTKPNIIFIQLESFFDVDTLTTLSLSQDALPNFHALQENYSTGLITVPTVGAGTVNTEFEVLTGMSQKDFGTSEYPYKTILRSTATESICYNLKNLGYKTHCVHNNEGTFYGRNKVFENLGFDSFTFMEFMNGLEDNPNGWKKDDILVEEIIKTLDSTDGVDFTLGITVQSHGKYAGFEVDEDAPIQIREAPEGKEDSWLYYINQLYEVDQMIGDLVAALEEREEETVLVLYGDHLPSLDIQKEELTDSNLYQTQYVIWDNIGLEREEKNLTSYQLSAEVLSRIGIYEGNITKYHQNSKRGTKTYHENLRTLEYDMLYGENYAFEGENPYEPTQLQMGTEPITLTDVEKNEQGYLLEGSGFTPYAHLYFQGEELSIEWVDEEHIQILEELVYETQDEEDTEEQEKQSTGEEESSEEDKLDIPNAFLVQIQTDGGTVLGESDVLLWKDTSLKEEAGTDTQ
ncbi:MAG: sulfatase-like hydrolase/transferase [Clostridiaceae bacterium]|nr:sulfatase-like hydrolase/transferase [Clostridiaceae bacterium]